MLWNVTITLKKCTEQKLNGCLSEHSHPLMDVRHSHFSVPVPQEMCIQLLFSPGNHSQTDATPVSSLYTHSHLHTKCNEAAIGLPVWLLSYYQTEVVSCHLCTIADSLDRVKCVSLGRTHILSHRGMCSHLYSPRLEFHSERLQNITSIPSTDGEGGAGARFGVVNSEFSGSGLESGGHLHWCRRGPSVRALADSEFRTSFST